MQKLVQRLWQSAATGLLSSASSACFPIPSRTTCPQQWAGSSLPHQALINKLLHGLAYRKYFSQLWFLSPDN